MPSSFPFIGGGLLCFQEAALEHSEAPLPSVDAPHGILRSWALSILPWALLKSRVFVLQLVFSILRRLLNTTALRSALGVTWSHKSCSGSSERSAVQCSQQQPSSARSWRVTRAAALFSQQAARQSKSHSGRPTSVFLRLPRVAEARFFFLWHQSGWGRQQQIRLGGDASDAAQSHLVELLGCPWLQGVIPAPPLPFLLLRRSS